MKKTLLPVLVAMVIAVGCQNQHAKYKDAAQERWKLARARLATDLARQQLQAGDLHKAANTARDALEASRRYAPLHAVLGQVYLEQNRIADARATLQACLEIQPDYAEGNYYLGVACQKLNDHEKALTHYHVAWRSRPDHVPYLLAVAETLVSLNRRPEALNLLTDHIQGGTQDASVYLAAGHILQSQNEPDQALLMFRKAKGLSPDNADITEALAFALHEADRTSEALALFEELARQARQEKRPFGAANRLALGDCYLKLNRFHRAQNCYEQVSKQDADNTLVWTRLAQCALGQEDLERAQRLAHKALSLQRGQPDALIVLGYVALKQNKHDEAQITFRRVISRDTDNALAYCLLGQSLQAAGDTDEAAKCYSQALRINPDDALARKLLASLGKMQLGKKQTPDKF